MKKRGFTLIELMIVVAIIGILLVILLGRVTRAMDRAREKTTHKNLKNIKIALDLYCETPDGDYNYPTTREEFKEILNKKFDNKTPRAVLRLGAGVSASNETYLGSSTADIPIAPEGGWVLITSGPNRGEVYINSTATDTNGDCYTTYPCW